MTFLHASLLAGTALVALPIVLHLIMRQKPKRLEFPALRFIARRHETNQRKLRLRHLVLLALRAAAIALLAFALARPRVEPTAQVAGMFGSQEEPVAAALVFDCAPRMQYRHENRSRLEAAQELGQWLLTQLPPESQLAVLDTRAGPAAFQVDSLAAKERIARLEQVANSQPLASALEEALQLLAKSDLAHREVYIFTDLARGAWPADAAARLQEHIAEAAGVGIYVIDVGVKEPTDYALGSLRLSGQVLSSRSTLRIETELSHIGPAGQRGVEICLLDAQRKEQKRDEVTCKLDPGQSQQVSFTIGGLEVGTHQGLLRIMGQDGLADDDTRYFTVEVKPAWRVLIAAPKPAQEYALYLNQALAPVMSRRRGEVRFDCEVVVIEEVGRRPLDEYAAVCVLDPTPLEPPVWRTLGNYAADGHGVAIFLGRNAEQVESFNAAVAQELLPGKLVRQARAPDGDVYLAPRDLEHPILAEFRGVAGAIPWKDSPVFRYWQLEQAPVGVSIVVPLNNRQPVLLERPVGKGRVLTMTTPASDDPNRNPWNLLPLDWPFMILTNQMVSYLVGSGDERLNYFAGQAAVLPLDAQQPRSTYLLTTPGNLKFPVAPDVKQRTLVITSTDQVGNYRVQAGAKVDRGFSVNLAPEQTALQRLGDDELTDIFGKYKFRVARTRNEIERDVSTGRVGQELFPLLILLVALVLAAEHVVANRFYRE